MVQENPDLGELPVRAFSTVVKNTFIEIDLPSEIHVQRRSLSCPPVLSRSSRKDVHRSTAEVVPPPLATPRKLQPPQPIFAGAQVEIYGLGRAPHFNGRVGIVESFDSDMDRYVVVLDANQSCPVKVKGANLRLHAEARPPCFEPTLDIPTLCLDNCVSDSTPSMPGTPRWEDEVEVLGAQTQFGLQFDVSFGLTTQTIPSVELQYNDGASSAVAPFVNWGDDNSMFAAYGDWQPDCSDYGIPQWEDCAIPR